MANDSEKSPLLRYPILLKLFIWFLIFSLIFLLRSFALLIFLTFIFSYIQANGVQRLTSYIKYRIISSFMIVSGILLLVTAAVLFLLPRIQEQTEIIITQFPVYLKTIDLHFAELSQDYPLIDNKFPQVSEFSDKPGSWTLERSPTREIILNFLKEFEIGVEHDSFGLAVKYIRVLVQSIIGSISSFLLALLFSFLIVLDLPKLSKATKELADTKIGFIYNEVAENINSFARVLGKAMEAQLFIAIANTVLTALGLWLMNLHGNVAFLSVIVFICSFIPVAGVFISSAPICLIAIQQGGVNLVLFAILLISIIHLVEAYILNPRIYGHHMRMNPVIVLIILTIGGKLFGIWGLILGVPISNYIFRYAIRHPHQIQDSN